MPNYLQVFDLLILLTLLALLALVLHMAGVPGSVSVALITLATSLFVKGGSGTPPRRVDAGSLRSRQG